MKAQHILAMALLLGAVACNKEPAFETIPKEASGETGILSIILAGDDVGTKALTAYTEAIDYETKVNSVQLLIFNGDGDLVKDARFTSSFTSMQTSIPTGTYTVWAIVNDYLEYVYNEWEIYDEFMAYISVLDDNSISGKSFVMSGSASCTVKANTTSSCPISVKRLVGRVALNSVKFNLPKGYDIYLDYAYLSNVCGKCLYDGNALSSDYYYDMWEFPYWLNYDGYQSLPADPEDDFYIQTSRKKITGASTAQLPALTAFDFGFCEMGVSDTWTRDDDDFSHVLFYGYPNCSTRNPSGPHTYFEDQKTCLVVVADIYSGYGNGGTNYYVIPLDSFEANKTYTIDLTITGFGTDDPNKPVEKGTVNASITVSGWSSGQVIDKTI